MWVAVAFVAITLTGTAFMLRVLLALLRKSASSNCYWVVPIRREPERESPESPRGARVDGKRPAPGNDPSDYYIELLENEGHAKKFASGLIALDFHRVSDNLGRRSVHKRAHAFHQPGL